MAISLDAIIQDMKVGFERNNEWFKTIFQWTPLGHLLKKNELIKLWDFVQTYSASTLFVRWWFRRIVRDFEHQFQLDWIVHIIQILTKENLLNEEIFFSIIQSKDYKEMIEIFELLQKEGILTKENMSLIIQYENIPRWVWTFSVLQGEQLLTQNNFDLIIHHQKQDDIYPLILLQEARLLNQENFNRIILHPYPNHFVLSLSILQRSHLLTQENFEIVTNHVEHEAIAWILHYLNQANILTLENRTAIINNSHIYQLAELLEILQHAMLLNQTNLDAILLPQHAILLHEEILNIVWARITQHYLTQQNFNRLLTAAVQNNSLEAFRVAINQILNEINRLGIVVFNQPQSTHTASVHRTVSESATKLKALYGHINQEDSIKKMKNYINSLPEDDLKYNAAKNAIDRLSILDTSFIDATSDVSIYELLAYAYEAIHDNTKRIGTIEDAKTQFIEGLYEIQRGYNINDEGMDNEHDEEGYICMAGSFNKIIEKLNGVHRDIEVLYITPAGASLKLTRIATQHAINYLESLNKERFKEFSELLKEGTLEPVWPWIRATVEEELWNEFKEAFENNRDDKRFKEIIDNGVYIPAPSLTIINQIEKRSSVTLSNSSNTFWSKTQLGSDVPLVNCQNKSIC